MKDPMYLCVGTAKPSKKNTQYAFEKNHALLVFVKANSIESGTALATEHLEATEWMEVVIDKCDLINPEAINNAQPEILNAYKLALKDGSHGMVIRGQNT